MPYNSLTSTVHDRVSLQREDLSNLPFTTMCIRESLRLHSPVQAVTRTYTQDMTLPGDCTIPKGERNWLLKYL